MIPGPMQIILIIVLVILLFGAGRLPRIMGDIAKGIQSFKSGMKDDDDAPKDDNKDKAAQDQKLIEKKTDGASSDSVSDSLSDSGTKKDKTNS